MATIAVFLVLSGGTAVALNGSNTVFSDDIVNNQVYSADVRNDGLAGGGLAATDLRAGAVGTSEVLNDSLTHGDIANAASGSDDVSADLFDGFDSRFYVRGYSSSQSSNVTGRSSLHSNRVVLVPGDPAKELFDLNGVFPNLGDLTARCFNDHADILWRNSTGRTIDLWQEVFGAVHPRLMPPQGLSFLANSDNFPGSTFALGVGNDPGRRSIAIVHGFAFQSEDGAPCGLQAQAMVWTSE
jgi:hypothetical protein